MHEFHQQLSPPLFALVMYLIAKSSFLLPSDRMTFESSHFLFHITRFSSVAVLCIRRDCKSKMLLILIDST